MYLFKKKCSKFCVIHLRSKLKCSMRFLNLQLTIFGFQTRQSRHVEIHDWAVQSIHFENGPCSPKLLEFNLPSPKNFQLKTGLFNPWMFKKKIGPSSSQLLDFKPFSPDMWKFMTGLFNPYILKMDPAAQNFWNSNYPVQRLLD